MNYQKAYQSLIRFRLITPLPIAQYGEKHHILPVSLGGTNDKSNIVKLSPREHFLAHRLLAKIHGGKMWAALAYMSRGATKSAKGIIISARLYERIKLKDAEWRSVAYAGVKNPWYKKEVPEYVREKMKGPRPNIAGVNNPNYGKKDTNRNAIIAFVRSYGSSRNSADYTVINRINYIIGIPEYYDSLGNKKKKPKNTDQVKLKKALMMRNRERRCIDGIKNPNFGNGDKIRGEKNPMYGASHSQETKAKISLAATMRKKTTCPKCSKQGNVSNMKRWHFENCRAA